MARFLQMDGAETVYFDYLRHKQFRRMLRIPGLVFKMLTIPQKNSEVIGIYPYGFDHPTVVKILRLLRPIFHMRGITLTAVLVDVNAIRFREGAAKDDVVPLNCFDRVLVHSKAMGDTLLENGLKCQTIVMGLMDYYVQEKSTVIRHLSHEICFAGNLLKSTFLSSLRNMTPEKLHLNLYGADYSTDACPAWATYQGRFIPDKLDGIKGSWGLVWDGDGIDSITGFLGSYLRINSPHKASMYLCAGLPVIAPNGTNAGNVVKEHRLGFVIDSLSQIEGIIDSITEEEYEEILNNVKKYSERLMSGRNMLDALEDRS